MLRFKLIFGEAFKFDVELILVLLGFEGLLRVPRRNHQTLLELTGSEKARFQGGAVLHHLDQLLDVDELEPLIRGVQAQHARTILGQGVLLLALHWVNQHDRFHRELDLLEYNHALETGSGGNRSSDNSLFRKTVDFQNLGTSQTDLV